MLAWHAQGILSHCEIKDLHASSSTASIYHNHKHVGLVLFFVIEKPGIHSGGQDRGSQRREHPQAHQHENSSVTVEESHVDGKDSTMMM